MSEYTAEDFAGASFARHADGGTARRARHGIWDAGRSGRKRDDEDMARGGWVPVVEATEVMLNRQVDAEAHLDQIARLSRSAVEAEDRAVAAEDARRSARAAVDDLRQENDRLERIIQTPIKLADLERAWEAAEVPTADNPIREGDEAITAHADSLFSVRTWKKSDRAYAPARILHRAPQRPEWADLADVLRAHTGEPDPDDTAQMLHERGVRVVGGEES